MPQPKCSSAILALRLSEFPYMDPSSFAKHSDVLAAKYDRSSIRWGSVLVAISLLIVFLSSLMSAQVVSPSEIKDAG